MEDEEQDERGFWTRGSENCEEGTEKRAAVHAGGAVHHAVHEQETVRRGREVAVRAGGKEHGADGHQNHG